MATTNNTAKIQPTEKPNTEFSPPAKSKSQPTGKNNGDTSAATLERALETLHKRGPLKIQELAKAIGHTNPRSLSLILQWSKSQAKNNGGKWRIEEEHKI